jgi:CopG family transcriptional regulator, nickel-responsive regulator
MRDLLREAVETRRGSAAKSRCVTSLFFAHDHHARLLAQRLMEIGHDHLDLSAATMHVHLDHANCLETIVLKGIPGK